MAMPALLAHAATATASNHVAVKFTTTKDVNLYATLLMCITNARLATSILQPQQQHHAGMVGIHA